MSLSVRRESWFGSQPHEDNFQSQRVGKSCGGVASPIFPGGELCSTSISGGVNVSGSKGISPISPTGRTELQHSLHACFDTEFHVAVKSEPSRAQGLMERI